MKVFMQLILLIPDCDYWSQNKNIGSIQYLFCGLPSQFREYRNSLINVLPGNSSVNTV
jgi:hypothetical protein